MDKNAEEINEFMYDLPGKITEARKELEKATHKNKEELEMRLAELEKEYKKITDQVEELEGATEKVWDGFHESLKKSVHEVDKGIRNILDTIT